MCDKTVQVSALQSTSTLQTSQLHAATISTLLDFVLPLPIPLLLVLLYILLISSHLIAPVMGWATYLSTEQGLYLFHPAFA